MTRPRLRQVVPAGNVMLLGLSALVGLIWLPALFWCVLYAMLLVSASVVCAVRLRSGAGLLAGPALASMHLSWGLGYVRQLSVDLWSQQRRPAGSLGVSAVGTGSGFSQRRNAHTLALVNWFPGHHRVGTVSHSEGVPS
jgi:hypothetical protein